MDVPRRANVSGIDRARFEEFLIEEARLLDERRFREWMGLFSEDGTYWVPAVPGQASPFDQVSLFARGGWICCAPFRHEPSRKPGIRPVLRGAGMRARHDEMSLQRVIRRSVLVGVPVLCRK